MRSLEADGMDMTADMIERQMRLRDAQVRSDRERHGKTTLSRYRFLTVTRDGGSLADEIVRDLAGRLGWHVFDSEIVDFIARDSHVRENLVRELDERSQGLIQDAILRMLRMPEYPSFGAEEYPAALLKTLAYIATQGNAILVGRGANFALCEEKEGLKVRITGSVEARALRIKQKFGMTLDAARERTKSEDEERSRFIRQYYKQDIDDVRFYDLIFNTDHLSVDSVAASLAAILMPPKLA
jgi:phage anti-repressor protein